ncbi:hydroxyacylglutathione hydrolase [Bdellovibrio bacteriovorus]
MNHRVELIPIFEDNYVFALINEQGHVVLVDPGESTPVEKFLEHNDYDICGILLTHHHNDHIGGVTELIKTFPAPIYAPLKNKTQISFADHYVKEGDEFMISDMNFKVMELPGHTLGHVAYWNPDKKWLFSGDVLFGLGCGRLFEGTFEQMYESLQKIKALPNETLIYCTHEYTEMNLQFCKMLGNFDDSPITGDDENLELYENELTNKRSLDLPSVPLKLFVEKKVNPFLLASSVKQFSALRELRNKQ